MDAGCVDRRVCVRFTTSVCIGLLLATIIVAFYDDSLPVIIASTTALVLLIAIGIVVAMRMHMPRQLPHDEGPQEQVPGTATVTVRFDDLIVAYVTEGIEEMCAICHEIEPPMAVLPCGHKFHAECLREWFARKIVCPICNADPIATILFEDIVVVTDDEVANA